jgi:hypothetical protein
MEDGDDIAPEAAMQVRSPGGIVKTIMRNLNVGMMARLRRLRTFGKRHWGVPSAPLHRIAKVAREASDFSGRSCGQTQRGIR